MLDQQIWWKNDHSTSDGTHVDSLTTSYGLSQTISDPTHIPPNSYSCIYLIFTNQPPKMLSSYYIRETQSQSRVSSFVQAINLGLQ